MYGYFFLRVPLFAVLEGRRSTEAIWVVFAKTRPFSEESVAPFAPWAQVASRTLSNLGASAQSREGRLGGGSDTPCVKANGHDSPKGSLPSPFWLDSIAFSKPTKSSNHAVPRLFAIARSAKHRPVPSADGSDAASFCSTCIVCPTCIVFFLFSFIFFRTHRSVQ